MTAGGGAPPTFQVTLRDPAEADVPTLFQHQQDPESVRMAAFPKRDWDAFVAHWKKISADEAVIMRTVLVDGEVAGSVGSFERNGVREVGYWFGREHWGKGVATKALAAFLDIDVSRPLYARVVTHNRGSLRVLEKCGFVIVDEDLGSIDVPGEEVEEHILRLNQD